MKGLKKEDWRVEVLKLQFAASASNVQNVKRAAAKLNFFLCGKHFLQAGRVWSLGNTYV